MNARAVAAWSGACLFIVLLTSNPAYKALVLAAAFTSVAAAGIAPSRMRRMLAGVALIAAFDAGLNFVSAHLGRTVLFSLPDGIPAIGGPYTLEALAFGVSGGMTIAAAILAASPFSLVLRPHEVVDALPAALSRTGTAIAASMNLVPSVASSFMQVSEAQRLRGWRPRGPRSWAEVVVPVVMTSVEGSIQLAESMEARGFGSGPRTFLQPSQLQAKDWTLVAAAALAVMLFVTSQIAGWAADWYPYPSLELPRIDIAPLIACGMLFAPVLVWRSRD